MLALGLILVLIVVVVVVFVVIATSGLDPIAIDYGVFSADLTPLQLFLLGVGTVLVLALGVVVLAAGMRKQRTKNAEVKRLRKEVDSAGGGTGRPTREPRAEQEPTTSREPTTSPKPSTSQERHRDASPRRSPAEDSQRGRARDTDPPPRREDTGG